MKDSLRTSSKDRLPTEHRLTVLAPKPAASFALAPEFWAHFVEHYWEQRPCVIKQPFVTPLATPAATFEGLVQEQYRVSAEAVSMGFYIESAQLLAEVWKFIPESGDQSLAGYAARVTRQLQGRRFGLIVEDFQEHAARLWLRICEFLRSLYPFTGLPGTDAKALVFLGNYEKTPFGLHDGNSSNFAFVVAGRKRLRVWPAECLRAQPGIEHTLDYERFLDDSIAQGGRSNYPRRSLSSR